VERLDRFLDQVCWESPLTVEHVQNGLSEHACLRAPPNVGREHDPRYLLAEVH
jgi:hypothetical protein